MTSHAMRRALDLELVRENITLRQWEVLAWIVYVGEPSQAELAERLGIEAPTLAGIISRMERDGWLERFNCPDDRRKKRIRPSDKVEPVWNRMVDCCHRVRNKSVQGISEDDLATFKRVCATLRQNLGGCNSEKPDNAADCASSTSATT